MKIELINIYKSFSNSKQKVEVFNDFSLVVSSGEFVTILGPNGCGKTTLLNLINGLDIDFKGKIIVEESNNGTLDFAFMMQKDLLLPWRTVYDNIIIGLQIKNKVTSDTLREVEQYLEKFGIDTLKDEYPSRLSGGERQKVALIRTLILNSEILLLDEPFSAIDYNTRLELQTRIFSLVKESGKTAIMVTHDIDEAIAVSDRIIVLNQKPFGINTEIKIELNSNYRSPLLARQHPEFAKYYSQIWNSLPKQSLI